MKLKVWQLALHVRDHEPDGTVYGSEAEAEAAKVKAAREHLSWLILFGHDMEELCEYADVEPDALSDLSDEDVLVICEAWNGGDESFEAAVYQTWVEIPLDTLTDAIRDAGMAVCVFQPEDVEPLIDDPTAAASWLLETRNQLEDRLSYDGFEAIQTYLNMDGRARDA